MAELHMYCTNAIYDGGKFVDIRDQCVKGILTQSKQTDKLNQVFQMSAVLVYSTYYYWLA